jgi:hypothetical protein
MHDFDDSGVKRSVNRRSFLGVAGAFAVAAIAGVEAPLKSGVQNSSCIRVARTINHASSSSNRSTRHIEGEP